MTDGPLDLTTIEARLEDITDGPWIAEYSGEQGDCVIPADADSTREAVCITRLYYRHNDAEFIAHARADIPDLLAEVKQLRAQVAAALGVLDGLSARYTVGPSNYLRVLSLYLNDIREALADPSSEDTP